MITNVIVGVLKKGWRQLLAAILFAFNHICLPRGCPGQTAFCLLRTYRMAIDQNKKTKGSSQSSGFFVLFRFVV